ncbi:CatA-like O-acetyltransferase [Clostridioides mangenotii]|uniref:CatA-like O-acetyltransferase n=1 Tax=Metaclostridioides mangenotii TaxID=1540 RepID=UPI002149BFAB|nr:CatA-like O-acetyltransferase [Clostridioides mangenotii]MCR1955703.1 CatA-like O-acetyltransferase [Clostridioides mangenotii]
MEKYKIIDINEFDRSEYFQYFMSVGTTIEITVKVDVTNAVKKCKLESLSFYSFLIFNISQALNSIRNFRYSIYNESLVEWKKVIPTFTNFNKSNETFSTLWEEPQGDYAEFDRKYKQLTKKFSESKGILPQVDLPPNVFNVSSIPWIHFEHFSSNTNVSGNQLTTMITMGKYEKHDSKLLMPITVQAHHAIVDGYHISQFFNKLQDEMNKVF